MGRRRAARVHDDEADTFRPMAPPEEFCARLAGIGVEATPNGHATGDVEGGDYYSRLFSGAPRMVTNRGSLEVSGTNIDAVHIVQKG